MCTQTNTLALREAPHLVTQLPRSRGLMPLASVGTYAHVRTPTKKHTDLKN